MLTPSQLSVEPKILQIVVPDYDFQTQRRWDGFEMMGKYTASSLQTFDSKGQPKDSQSDSND